MARQESQQMVKFRRNLGLRQFYSKKILYGKSSVLQESLKWLGIKSYFKKWEFICHLIIVAAKVLFFAVV